jgi:DNA-binding transcriptional ArsR family regulator
MTASGEWVYAAALARRPLLAAGQARDIARLFRLLANETRVRVLHALVREGELSVGDLAVAIGMTPQATSNQLQRLVDTGMLRSRREGARVFYRVDDPCLPELLEMALCLVEGEGESE